MATKIYIVTVLLSIPIINCQHDGQTTKSFTTVPEHLMRNQEFDDAELIDAPITLIKDNRPKSTDPDAVTDAENDKNITTTKEVQTDYRNEENLNTEPDSTHTIDVATSTELYTAEQHTLSYLIGNFNNDGHKQDELYNQKEHITSIDPTTVTEVYTKDGDRQKDTIDEDSNHIYTTVAKIEMKEETSTSAPMTTDQEQVEARRPPEEIESIQQRNPKTERTNNSEVNTRSDHERKTPRPMIKTTKSSTLKGWIEDTWLRPPAGLLVPLRAIALNRAMAVWRDLTEEGLNVSDIIVIGYDANGVNWRSRHSLQNNAEGTHTVYEALSKLLLKYQGVHANEAKGDGTMQALASAAKLVPYDSALFVITDRAAADPQKLPLALKALVEKRLKVYTIWTDPSINTPESDVALADFKKISRHTEGDILPYSLQVKNMNIEELVSQMGDWGMDTVQTRNARLNANIDNEQLETLLVRRGGGDTSSLGIPVEAGVKALRILIEGAVDHAVLYPPNDAPLIDLYNKTSISEFSPLSNIITPNPRDVVLVFPGAKFDDEFLSVLPVGPTRPIAREPTAGTWHLSVRCDTCDYRLTMRARALIGVEATVLPENGGKEMLRLKIIGPVGTIRETTIVDEYGTELAKLPFNYEPAAGHQRTFEAEVDQAALMVDLVLPPVMGNRVYVKLTGRDLYGESFVRLAGPLYQQRNERSGRSAIAFPQQYNEFDPERNRRAFNNLYNNSDVLPNNRATSQVLNQGGSLLTTVQIGLSTRLYGAPGENLQLHFEVTNYRDRSVSFRFEAVGELRFLRGISPATQWIGSGQTANVIVSVGITNSAQPGARDLITFTATGLEQVSISTYVYVINRDTVVTDIWAPTMRHVFQGSCIGRQGDDCAQHAWSATIFARDAAGGLLRLSSTPVGLMYQSNFIAGTREEVTATYRATCCAPRVMVNAVDAYGNANSYVVDISNYFTEAAIAAIVLGVLLVIALLIAVAFLIFWCVRKRKESRELPYSTSRRDIS